MRLLSSNVELSIFQGSADGGACGASEKKTEAFMYAARSVVKSFPEWSGREEGDGDEEGARVHAGPFWLKSC